MQRLQPSTSLHRAELSFCFILNPLSLYLMWTMHIIYFKCVCLSILAHMAFSYLALFFYLGPFMGDFTKPIALFLPLVYAMVGSELKKGGACVVSLYLVRSCFATSYLSVLFYWMMCDVVG